VMTAAAKWEEEEREVTIPTTRNFTHGSIMVVALVLWPPLGTTPSF
jgi:hypothetical protein